MKRTAEEADLVAEAELTQVVKRIHFTDVNKPPHDEQNKIVDIGIGTDPGSTFSKASVWPLPEEEEGLDTKDTQVVRRGPKRCSIVPSSLGVLENGSFIIDQHLKDAIAAGQINRRRILTSPKLLFVPNFMKSHTGHHELSELMEGELRQVNDEQKKVSGPRITKHDVLVAIFKIIVTRSKEHAAEVFEVDESMIRAQEMRICLPQAWTGDATRPFIDAAQEGVQCKLRIVPENDCIAGWILVCDRHNLNIGDKFVVIDLGGGTVDASTYEVVAKPDGDCCRARSAGGLGGSALAGSELLNRKWAEVFQIHHRLSKIAKKTGQSEDTIQTKLEDAINHWKMSEAARSGGVRHARVQVPANSSVSGAKDQEYNLDVNTVSGILGEVVNATAGFAFEYMKWCLDLGHRGQAGMIKQVFLTGGGFLQPAIQKLFIDRLKHLWSEQVRMTKKDVRLGVLPVHCIVNPYKDAEITPTGASFPREATVLGAPFVEALILEPDGKSFKDDGQTYCAVVGDVDSRPGQPMLHFLNPDQGMAPGTNTAEDDGMDMNEQ